MKFTHIYWFTPAVTGPVGIVVGVDEVTGKRKAYIGSVPHGGAQESDTQMITELGAKVSKSILLEIASKL